MALDSQTKESNETIKSLEIGMKSVSPLGGGLANGMEAEEATGHVSLPWQHFGCCSSELTWDDDDDELISVMNQEGLTPSMRPIAIRCHPLVWIDSISRNPAILGL